jgi:uncharacterized protein (TIGR00730 family)
MKRICVYCGSSPGARSCHMETARKLGEALISSGYELVYGGASVGLMGRVADTVIEGGGVAIGVIPEAFAGRVSHRGLTELHVVGSMHERKVMMFDLADAFIALPGGFGTLEEIMETLTWAQLGFHKKPCGLVNVDGYYDAFLTFLDNAVRNGFIKREHREMLLVARTPEDLLAQMKMYSMPSVEKWV